MTLWIGNGAVLKSSSHWQLTLSQTTLVFTCLLDNSFENTVGKGETAISPFPTMFSTLSKNFLQLFIKFEIAVCKLFQFGRV